LAGTAKQYSGKAISHEIRMNPTNGMVAGAFKCQYHATVMNTFEANNK
jgi:hypothetical protein